MYRACTVILKSLSLTQLCSAWHAGGQEFESPWLHSQNADRAVDLSDLLPFFVGIFNLFWTEHV